MRLHLREPHRLGRKFGLAVYDLTWLLSTFKELRHKRDLHKDIEQILYQSKINSSSESNKINLGSQSSVESMIAGSGHFVRQLALGKVWLVLSFQRLLSLSGF